MKIEHGALLGAALLLVFILWSSHCDNCQAKLNAINGAQGGFPGSGRGVEVR